MVKDLVALFVISGHGREVQLSLLLCGKVKKVGVGGPGGYGYRFRSSLKISMSKNFCNYLCLLFLMLTSGDLFYSRPAQFRLLLQKLSFFIGPFELFHCSMKALLLTSK